MDVSQRRVRTIGTRSGMVGRRGFTLTEMLVVIAIAVMLLALLIPTGQSLREGNRMMTCRSQLHQISQALKAYRMDEGGVPPYYYLHHPDHEPTDTPHGPGLMQLYLSGYIARQESLHCPRDVYTEPGTEEYFQSYIRRDEDVKSDTELNRYTYLSTRGVTDTGDPYYYRQLQPARQIGAATPLPVIDLDWRPADDTVITWCSFHVEHVQGSEGGQYNVLLWDGTVQRVGENLMRPIEDGDDIGPDAAWKVGAWERPVESGNGENGENGENGNGENGG